MCFGLITIIYFVTEGFVRYLISWLGTSILESGKYNQLDAITANKNICIIKMKDKNLTWLTSHTVRQMGEVEGRFISPKSIKTKTTEYNFAVIQGEPKRHIIIDVVSCTNKARCFIGTQLVVEMVGKVLFGFTCPRNCWLWWICGEGWAEEEEGRLSVWGVLVYFVCVLFLKHDPS